MPNLWRSRQRAADRPGVTDAFVAELQKICGSANVRVDEPMSRHTTYRVGGPADVLVVAPDLAALQVLLPRLAAAGLPVEILGGGSNVLVLDGGVRGVVLQLGAQFAELIVRDGVDGDIVVVGASLSLGYLIKEAKLRGWTGVAPLAGTPGTVGGALRMNAGARRVWIGDFVQSVEVVTREGRLRRLRREDLQYGYRSSRIPAGAVIVSGTLQMQRGDADAERRAIDEYLKHRRDTQPLSQASCGSVFRNPEGASAGALIEKAGLKGVRLRQAQISDKHANFIVNLGGATARDVLALVRLAKDTVQRETGIRLEEELRVIGEHDSSGDES
jgi:UDP-N-acetylmuramate dehydrogenase